MSKQNYIGLLFLTLLLLGCKSSYKFKLTTSGKVTIGNTAVISLKEINKKPIDSVQFFINGEKIASKGTQTEINTTSFGLGKQSVSALISYSGKTKKLNNFIEILAAKPPLVYSYKIINVYPHDTAAYTQGLEYHNGFLYETTGEKGQSSLRKIAIKTGKVLQKVDLNSTYFGEGMTIFNNKIYWLTWQSKKGFVYDLKTFKQQKSFNYNQSKEGWGLTHNATELIKSDGTHKIWFLDPKTLQEKRFIQVYTNKYALEELNEIEFIDGKIYANKWQQNAIVIIDAKTGTVEGVVDLSGLKKEVEKTQKLENQDEVLNGIAYDAKNKRLFVTGKHWGKLFEIQLVKGQ